ncbi:STM4504/CBY_0614 family protein [Pseudoalteromonas sp. BSi20495]|uniref:STM4504/CBY_0614 family protein n=1 Tax=Pseudoalteromonas sp. BSi20495 TaxID=386429 RepID=UPI00023159BD|nr:hypothetical protein [Pseudoalteromonas sp. BSi20495]GAA78188.1 hypothetical protein P20495_0679 [Pseudoalteromonas sp. BSi20495]
MAIHETYSKRQAKLNNEQPDVYLYDKLPEKLKIQIIHIWENIFINARLQFTKNIKTFYEKTHKILCSDLGVFALPYVEYDSVGNPSKELLYYFTKSKSVNEDLTVIEEMFKLINNPIMLNNKLAAEAINDLNIRFKENSVGYQFLNNEIVRVDSEIIHSETVVPALRLLNQKEYVSAESEFLNAHKAYRNGENGTAILECNKAFESVMKVIIHKQGWAYDEKGKRSKTKATASSLIEICFENNLFPDYLKSQVTALRTLIQSSIPTIRNKNGSHGTGLQTVDIPTSLASFTLHMTASTILFLIESEKSL